MNLFHYCLQRCGCSWMLHFFVLFFSSPSQGKSPPHLARLWERAWDQEDIGAVQSFLEDTLLPCSRLNLVLFHVATIVVFQHELWIAIVPGWDWAKKGIVTLVFNVILNTSLCVKRDLHCILSCLVNSVARSGWRFPAQKLTKTRPLQQKPAQNFNCQNNVIWFYYHVNQD